MAVRDDACGNSPHDERGCADVTLSTGSAAKLLRLQDETARESSFILESALITLARSLELKRAKGRAHLEWMRQQATDSGKQTVLRVALLPIAWIAIGQISAQAGITMDQAVNLAIGLYN